MAGVTTIIAVVALLVGLASVWLITETVKKMEIRTQKVIEIHLRGLRQSYTELSQVVVDMKAGQEDIRNRVRDVVRNRQAADVELAAVRQELDQMNKALNQAANKSAKGAQATSRVGRL